MKQNRYYIKITATLKLFENIVLNIKIISDAVFETVKW